MSDLTSAAEEVRRQERDVTRTLFARLQNATYSAKEAWDTGREDRSRELLTQAESLLFRLASRLRA